MDFLSINESTFIKEALATCERRIDGRGLYDYRRIGIQFYPNACELSLGDSLVFACVEHQIVEPFPDRPHEGFLNFTVEFSPMASPNFELILGRYPNKSKRIRNEFSTEIERLLDKAIKRSKALNTESLSILSGKYVWKLNVHLHILSSFGNLTDNCCLAALVSLLHTRIPSVKIISKNEIEVQNSFKSLSIHFLPVSITVGFISEYVIFDPGYKEEAILEGKLVVVMNIYGDILALEKTGAAAVSEGKMEELLEIARIKSREITVLLRNELANIRMVLDSQFQLNEAKASSLVASLTE